MDSTRTIAVEGIGAGIFCCARTATRGVVLGGSAIVSAGVCFALAASIAGWSIVACRAFDTGSKLVDSACSPLPIGTNGGSTGWAFSDLGSSTGVLERCFLAAGKDVAGDGGRQLFTSGGHCRRAGADLLRFGCRHRDGDGRCRASGRGLRWFGKVPRDNRRTANPRCCFPCQRAIHRQRLLRCSRPRIFRGSPSIARPRAWQRYRACGRLPCRVLPPFAAMPAAPRLAGDRPLLRRIWPSWQACRCRASRRNRHALRGCARPCLRSLRHQHLRQRLLHSTRHSGMSPSNLSMAVSFARTDATVASACSTVASTLLLGPRLRAAGDRLVRAAAAAAVRVRRAEPRLALPVTAVRGRRCEPPTGAGFGLGGLQPGRRHGHFGGDGACGVEKLAVALGQPAAVDLRQACRARP